jgi:phosphomannomutase
MVAGEESGGFGIAGHIPERDGILSGAARVEALAAGGAAAGAAGELEREAGWRHAYDRVDLPLAGPAELGAVLRRLEPTRASFAGRQVLSVERRDGVKLNLSATTAG